MKNWMRAIGIISLMLVALMPFVLAEENTTAETDLDVEAEQEAGITPDSMWYGVENAIENIDLALTFSPEKKAEKRLNQARERLYEVKLMLENGNADAAEKARERYEKHLDDAEDDVDDLESDGNTDEAKEAIAKMAKLREESATHYEKFVAVKERILERMQDRLTPEQYEKMQETFDRLANKSLEAQQKFDARRDAVKTKYRALSGLNETEVDELEEKLETDLGIAKERVERVRAQLKIAKERLEAARERLKEYRTNNVTSEGLDDLEEELELAEDALDEAANATDDELALRIRAYGNDIAQIARLLNAAHENGTFDGQKELLRNAINARLDANRDRIEMKLRERFEERSDEFRLRLEERFERQREQRNEIREKIRENVQERREKRNNSSDDSNDDSENETDNSGSDSQDDLNEDSDSEGSNDDSEAETDDSGNDSEDDLNDDSNSESDDSNDDSSEEMDDDSNSRNESNSGRN